MDGGGYGDTGLEAGLQGAGELRVLQPIAGPAWMLLLLLLPLLAAASVAVATRLHHTP
jgi:hypothetical protein